MRMLVLFFVAEKPFEYFPFPLRTYVYEEPLYLFLDRMTSTMRPMFMNLSRIVPVRRMSKIS